MPVSPDSIADHIIEHEILGIDDTGSAGVTVSGLWQADGVLWYEDTSRSKWLSADRATFGVASAGRAKNRYLSTWDGLELGVSGYRLPRDATLIAIAAQTRTAETWTVQIRKNDSATDLASLAIAASAGDHDTDIDVDFAAGDYIQIYAETTGVFGVRDPVVWIQIAWRNDSL